MTSTPSVGYLPLRILLTESLVVRTRFDPMSITTDTVISGRAQRGMLAAALPRNRHDELIDAWIARGEAIRFAPAFPRLEAAEKQPVATVPAPLSLSGEKKPEDTDKRALVDRLVQEPGASAVPLRALTGTITPDFRHLVTPMTSTEQYLGVERTGQLQPGVPFITTSLDPGQVFEARWRLSAGSPDELEALAGDILGVLAGREGRLSLGSGGTRAHGGGVRVTCAAPSGTGHTVMDRTSHARTVWRAGTDRFLVLLAPALLTDGAGVHNPLVFAKHALEVVRSLLGREREAVVPVGSYVEPRIVGAYHRLYHGPMAERRAAAPGSVLRLRACRDIGISEIRALEDIQLGERAVDGFGAFVLLPPPHDEAVLKANRKPVPACEQAPRGASPRRRVLLADGTGVDVEEDIADGTALRPGSGTPLSTLYDAMLWQAVAEPVRARARDLAAGMVGTLTPSLLGRLREIAAAPVAPEGNEDAARTTLKRLALAVTSDKPEASLGAVSPFKPFTSSALAAVETAKVTLYKEKTSVQNWLCQTAKDPAASWTNNKAQGTELAKAINTVDLAGGSVRDASGELSTAAQKWLSDPAVLARLSLLLITTWLAERTRIAHQNETERADRAESGERS
ncbi:hypothetical protein [Nocardiopsis ansamitocini]|uniref:Uncharacterized protein n=1 Tax=Nocardiopsis ansamitocini TaxID=1670832 RepID=A0A9W6UK08_9ACTN|nr:hypothetical protein [Nocardiopsis ansamitocini]GLU49429.1 hypothetical protein Nans01_37800 [Nocardiopsis ansamitocini]